MKLCNDDEQQKQQQNKQQYRERDLRKAPEKCLSAFGAFLLLAATATATALSSPTSSSSSSGSYTINGSQSHLTTSQYPPLMFHKPWKRRGWQCPMAYGCSRLCGWPTICQPLGEGNNVPCGMDAWMISHVPKTPWGYGFCSFSCIYWWVKMYIRLVARHFEPIGNSGGALNWDQKCTSGKIFFLSIDVVNVQVWPDT